MNCSGNMYLRFYALVVKLLNHTNNPGYLIETAYNNEETARYARAWSTALAQGCAPKKSKKISQSFAE